MRFRVMKNFWMAVLLLLLLTGCSLKTTSLDASFVKDTQVVSLNEGDTYSITADKIIKNINGQEHIMYGYNGQLPGPTLKVRQGSSITINFTNNLDEETTIHWHGLRHDYKDDGVPNLSQNPVKPGESYTYTLSFPDDGVYWYHPHIREDRQQDLGLYGNILVEPENIEYNSVDKEIFLMLDDILIENGKIIPYGEEKANYALMGRYGNVMLTNGMTDYELQINEGDVVRFYVTAVSNVRPFNLSISNTKLKIVGGDMGLYESEEFSDSILVTTAERYIIEAKFDHAGIYSINNINPWKSYELGKILVSETNQSLDMESTEDFNTLHSQDSVIADIEKYKEYFDKETDIWIDIGVAARMMGGMMEMHSTEDLEWEDFMAEENAAVDSDEVDWFIRDRETGLKNMNIRYEFKKGDLVKIEFSNNLHSMHPMQHSIHLHGQRFLVLEENGVANTNLVWKDTFLITNGGTATILLDASNPGMWMMHCHIAEHLESGMMGMFEVSDGKTEPKSDNAIALH